MTIAMIAIGIAPAKINVVPSVAFVPRITMSPSVGAPINDPTATTPIATTKAIRMPPIIPKQITVIQSFVALDCVSFPYLCQHP